MEALRRNVLVVLAPAVLLLAAGVAIGLLRKPTFTSEARLNVGGLSLSQQSIEGYTAAVQFLAVAYARAVDATPVVTSVARQLHLSPSTVVSEVSAAPITASPVITVQAKSKDAQQAVAVANATSNSLVGYAVHLNSGASTAQSLLKRYRAASHALQAANAHLQHLPPNSPQQSQAQVQVDTARLQMQTAGGLYQQSEVGQATENLVQRLAPASPATSDRSSALQRFAAGGLIAGLLIGVGLATERTSRLVLRRMPSSAPIRR
jgi:uncharacterized protein involved in exopolysaccharide biosynthesis